ncbi:MAG: hypothetical protein LBH66_08415 [Oscillospiraceae bacterium]|jgi:hypothetical protein|nr:hypothetical protein [Oscillospiraceae bacterium]
MNDLGKLTLILLPLMALGAVQMIFAAKRRGKLPAKFAALFFASGAVTVAFAAALWIIGARMLSA